MRNYVRLDYTTRHQTAINSETIFNLIIRCFTENSRKMAKEAAELIVDLIGVISEKNDEDKEMSHQKIILFRGIILDITFFATLSNRTAVGIMYKI